MDEMTVLRELRAEAPDASRAQLAAGRQRLLGEAAARGGRRYGVRVSRRFVVAGAAAAITGVAVLGTQVLGGAERVQPGAGQARTYELGSAKDLLNEAADAIEAGPAVTARNGQWIYMRTVETNMTDDERPGPRTSEEWERYADPAMEGGRAGDDRSPREQYEFLRSLPDDLAKVRAKARAFYYATDPSETRTEHEYRALTVVLSRAYVYDPEGLAKIYRALATIPGVRAAQVEDAAGRDAIALYLKGDDSARFRNETLLDPGTYLCTGFRDVALSGPTDSGTEWKKGDAIISGARVALAVVDDKGERP
ncbi:CU044_5270 family protein [Streptomyces sp. S.PB5]|uniref:CU044_5270 family protein n=1 Tax=Streptomyces sp. S.PB5 TaxID=3020844 RepID=UPI0025AF31A1|nr:CU044_5270 family protein [Streptomyces sp. S.PB5]MDN3021079.1 CU044_5270 family protein [Streptomyces sp. S.PB5]